VKEKAGDALLWQPLPKRDECSLELKQNRKMRKKKRYSFAYIHFVWYLYGDYTAIN